MEYTIECASGILFNKTKKNITSSFGYATIEDIELGNCNGLYKFKDNVMIKLNTKEIDNSIECESESAFILKLNECLINESAFCNIEINGLWLKTKSDNFIKFETKSDTYVDVKLIETIE